MKKSSTQKGLMFAWLLLALTSTLFIGCEGVEKGLFFAGDQRAGQKLFDYREIELGNGLKVVTLEDFSCPIVAAQVWYHVGSRNEDPGRQGFAHMFEHMMFKGTDRVAEKDHFAFIHRVGGTNNAHTGFDDTVYVQTLPADQLALALWLEAERMTFLKIDQASFDSERKVVEEELRMGENRPYGTLFKKEFAEIFKNSTYRWTPIGKLADLRAASVGELRDFWKRYYVPNNATLIIVGAVKHAEAQALAKQYFGWIPSEPKPERVTIREPKVSKSRTVVIDDENAPAGMVDITWRTVPRGHPDEVPLDLLSEILGGGNSSRLYREIVAERQLAVSADAMTFNLENDGVFGVNAVQQAGKDNADAILETFRKHIKRIQAGGVTSQELEKARNQSLKSAVTTNLSISSKASILGNAAVIKGDVSQVNRVFDEIRAVTVEDIQRVAKKYLTDDGQIVFIVKENAKGAMAGEKDKEDVPVTAERELQAPAPGRTGVARPKDFPEKAPLADLQEYAVQPKYTRTVLANGLKVIVVENHEVPFISVSLGLVNGAWAERKPATASMTLQMLTKGTMRHTEGALAAELEQYAISLNGSAAMDTSSVVASCLSEHIDRTMSLLAEVVLQPTFNAGEFEKLKKQVITGLAIEQQTPQYIADREFRRRLYGGHPYARTVSGEVADVEALTPIDLKLWWNKFARPDKATLIFAGDISQDEAVSLAKRTLVGWNTGLIETGLVLPDFPPAKPTQIYIVDRPGSMQSEIRIGQLGITRHEQPDYFISHIVTLYFGGSFNSRLNRAVRVERGLTYGARGGYYPMNMAGSFRIGTFTKNESTAETVKVIFEQIKRLRDEPPAADVLADAKSFFAGSFVRNRETPQAVAGDLWLVESQRLGADYLERLMAAIAETTAQQSADFARRTLDAEKMVVVVVGDAEKIKANLEAVAPVTVIKENAD
ncbi:MAG: insulinase family protein [Planctomycetes bacterium]|nr:insulinase family protein [Planctomycetota bacterium]